MREKKNPEKLETRKSDWYKRTRSRKKKCNECSYNPVLNFPKFTPEKWYTRETRKSGIKNILAESERREKEERKAHE